MPNEPARYRRFIGTGTFACAAWSERSREQIDKLQNLPARFEPANVAFVGLNLDDEPETAKEFVKSKAWKWQQAGLELAKPSQSHGSV